MLLLVGGLRLFETWVQGIEIVIIHKGDQPTFEEELAQDVLEIITVFSARLYGSRSRKHRKLMQGLQEEADKVVNKLEHSSSVTRIQDSVNPE